MAKASNTKKATKKAAPKKAAPAKKPAARKPAAKPQAPPPPPGSIRTHQLTMDERKQYAEMLFMRGDIDQQEIARIVQVSANTITKWVNDETTNWKGKRRSMLITKQEILRRLYSVVDKISQQIDQDESAGDTKKADMLIKYTTAIKTLETDANAADAIEVFMRFNKFMLTIDPAFVGQSNHYQDMFIKDLLKRI